MNSWLHHCFSRRTVLAGLRPSLRRADWCALLFLCAGLLLPFEFPVLGLLPPTTSDSKPEYIYQPPKSQVISDTSDFKVSVEFGFGTEEPSAANYPVVLWYRNGNYIGSVTSTVREKATVPTGGSLYACWDPYDDLGDGHYFHAVGPTEGKPGNTKQIAWKNELSVSVSDPGANKTAVYTAYIPALRATTPPAQVVLTPAQASGQVMPNLKVVRSPKDASVAAGGGVTLWGDALSRSNSLLRNPFGVAVDNQGLVYVADSLNHAIRRVTPGGKCMTVAGLDGAILDSNGDLMKTKKFDSVIGQATGTIYNQQGEMIPSIIQLPSVEGVAIGTRLKVTGGDLTTSAGTAGKLPTVLTVADVNAKLNTIAVGRVEATSGSLTFDIMSGSAPRGIYRERPPANGPPDLVKTETKQESKSGYRFPPDFPLDQSEYKSITASDQKEPHFDTPEALVAADDGSIFVADTQNDAIRRIYRDKDGKTWVQTICWGSQQFLFDQASAGVWGGTLYSNATNLQSGTVSLKAPRGIAYEGSMTDTTGKNPPVLYVLDFKSIHKITLNYLGQNGSASDVIPGSCVSTVAYIGSSTQAEGWQGNEGAARLYAPRGMVVTKEGDSRVIYVADTLNHVIRKLTLKPELNEESAAPGDWSSEIVAGFVGAKATTPNADGSTGYFPPVMVLGGRIGGGNWIELPSTVGILPNDSVLINNGTYTVGSIASGSLIMTGIVTGTGTFTATVRRAPSSAMNLSRLAYPSGLAMDRHNNLYFTEMGSHNLRRVVLDNLNPGVCARVETVAGQSKAGPTDGGSGEGAGTEASFFYPASLAYDTTGGQESFLLADSANSCIRRIVVEAKSLKVTGKGALDSPTKITNISNISGAKPLMRVTGLNIPPGAYIVSVDGSGSTITLNVPITNAVDNNQTLTLEQDTFTSVTALGYPGYSGNRDFSIECAEYTYQWLKYGTPLVNTPVVSGTAVNKSKTYIAGADSSSLVLNNVQTSDSGPYELTISNKFNITANTTQAALYVETLDTPAFLAPGYAQLVPSGTSSLGQLRSDKGDMNFALRAYITPADAVSYQWQTQTPSGWVDLNDSKEQQITDSAVSGLLGRDGSGGLTLEGTKTPTLKITGYQKSLFSMGMALPAVSFRVQALPLSGGSASVTGGSFTSTAAFAPVMGLAKAISVEDVDNTTIVNLTDGGSQAKFAQDRFSSKSTIPLKLTAQDSFSAFPMSPGNDTANPDFRVRYQWMKSAKSPSDATASPTVVSASAADYDSNHPPTLDLAFDGEPVFYFVRYWVGSGYPEDNDPATVIGRPVYGNFVKLTREVSASAGVIKYTVDNAAGEPDVKIVYVNGGSFSLDALVDSASGTPNFTWNYLKWGAAATEWKTISGGTASSAKIYAGTFGAAVDSLGTGTVTQSLTNASLSVTGFEKLPDLKTGYIPNKDISGLYRLDAVVVDGTSQSSPARKYWVVAMRQPPSAYGTDAKLYSLNNGPQTLLAVDSGSPTNVSLRADILLPLPDQIPMHTIYGGTLIDGATQSGINANSDTSATASGMYRWYRGTTPLSEGKNSATGNEVKINGGTLTITNIQEKDLGTYTLRVSNNRGTITNVGPSTSTASGVSLKGWSLVSNGLPAVLAPPSAKVTAGPDKGGPALSGGTLSGGTLVYRVAVGQTVALEIPVKSSYGMKYFWWFSRLGTGAWTSLPSATQNKDSKYFIRSASPLDSGLYRVDMNFYTDSGFATPFDVFKGDTTRSPKLKLVVEPVPDPNTPELTALGSTVSVSAGKKTLVAGGTATLAAVSSGAYEKALGLKKGSSFSSSEATRFFTYQWKKNGVALVGENKETLTLLKLTKSQAGSYTVDVSGIAGTTTSAPLLLAVTTKTASEVLNSVTFVNLNGTKYTINPPVAKGVAAGTALTLTGMSSETQTLLGWRVWDASGNAWDLPARNAQFTMPNQPVKISPTLGRPSIGWYSGFLSLEKPWGDLEWDIYPLMGLDPTLRGLYSKTPSAAQVRGYFQASISSLGVLSGKVLIEDKSYSFTSTMSVAPDGTYSGPIKIQATLADRTPWPLTGTVSLNMGLRKICTFKKDGLNADPYVITVPAGTAGLMETMSVSGYGIPEGTIITGVAPPDPITNDPSSAITITISNPVTDSTEAGVPIVFGADMAALDNVMHVTLNDVVLEVTPPVMKSGLPLYSVAACNAGATKSLRKFISDQTGKAAPRAPTYTSAIYRFGIKDASSVLGRGGVLSTNFSDLGYALITGYLPNGAKITFGGYGGRACYTQNPQDSDPLDPFLPVDSSGGTDLTGIATRVMQETLERHTASISIPIWSTSPKGDKPEEPLFGALMISDLAVHGCLGVLNAVPVAGGTVMVDGKAYPSGTISTASEYTHNYVKGYLYDPTVDPNWPKPIPFTPTGVISLYSGAPSADATTYPFNRKMGTLIHLGRGFSFVSSSAAIPAATFNVSLDAPTGLFSGSFVEQTDRYVSLSTNSGPLWASVDAMGSTFRAGLTVPFYAVTIQGGDSSVLGISGGAVGFMMRGTTKPDSLKNTLGNGYQDPSLTVDPTKPTFRTEALNINVFEKN